MGDLGKSEKGFPAARVEETSLLKSINLVNET
jgi:hypothetical protein